MFASTKASLGRFRRGLKTTRGDTVCTDGSDKIMHCNTSSVNLGLPVIRHAAVFVVVEGVGELQKNQKKY